MITMGLFRLQRRMVTTATKPQSNSTIASLHHLTILCKQGRLKEALQILHNTDSFVDSCTYVSLLQSCIQKKALHEGKQIEAHMNERRFSGDKLLNNTLINLYVKCESVVDARRTFDDMPERDVCSWTVIIAAYARHGDPREALSLFSQMQLTGFQPNQFTFASVLPALASLEQGMEAHKEIIRSGFQFDVVVANALVYMYARCGSVETARHVFDKISEPNVISWTTMIAGYAQKGQFNKALELFRCMPEKDLYSWTVMMTGYAQNGLVDEALKMFNEMPQRNVISWTVMIAGYAENGLNEEALKFFKKMQLAGVRPDSKTFASVLPACANLAAVEQGMEIHEKVISCGLQFDIVLMNALIDMYAKCGIVQKAHEVFDKMHHKDVISWTAMIAGYAQSGLIDEAVRMFQDMPQRDVISWNAMIAGFAQNGFVDEAMKLFEEMPLRTEGSWTAMILGFASNGLVDEALKLFKEIPHPTVDSWNAVITGLVQNGRAEESLKIFQQMQLAGVRPDSKTFSSVLPACASLADLEQGMDIHEKIIRNGFRCNVTVVNALIDMYAKCGSIEKAQELFKEMHHRNVVSCTVMIAGYAMHGCGKEALKLFEQMKHYGLSPSYVTLLNVLSACSHAGLVEEGHAYFNCMSDYYRITPAMEHYRCMVDLLGRAGRLDEAQDFISKMPIKPDAAVWNCLLGACRIHNNVELAECVAEQVFELDPKNSAPYVLLSNIYASAGRWGGIEKVRELMRNKGVKKAPGCSWIEVNKEVHAFLA